MKRSFFLAAVVSILLFGCTTRTLTKRLEKKLDRNYTRMLQAILKKSRRQHPTRHQLYGHLPPITKTIQVRRTRHTGHCWRSRDELLWIPTYGRAKAGWPARTYIQLLYEDTGCISEDLSETMNYREKWRERVRDIRFCGTTLWWWWRPFCHFYPSTTSILLKLLPFSHFYFSSRSILLPLLPFNHVYPSTSSTLLPLLPFCHFYFSSRSILLPLLPFYFFYPSAIFTFLSVLLLKHFYPFAIVTLNTKECDWILMQCSLGFWFVG